MVISETFIFKLKSESVVDSEKTLERLNSLLIQYPYFHTLHKLKWEILSSRKTISKNDRKNYSIVTNNRKHLIWSYNITNTNKKESITNFDKKERKQFINWLNSIEHNENESSSAFESSEKKITSLKNLNNFESSIGKQDDILNNQFFDGKILMTETLAKLYSKQGNIQKAVEAYKILSLKYPKKSIYFANQINKIMDIT